MKHGRAAGVFHLQIDDIVAHHSPDQELKYLRPQDAAHHIGVSKRQLETWAKEEKVTPPQKIGRKVALYHRATLLADIQRLCGVHGLPPAFQSGGEQ